MDEAIRKQGMLYLQQQRFGKKWRKVWSIVYGESTCSIARMEFFEFKDGGSNTEKTDKTLRKQENKKVIKLSDCIRVSEVDIEGCPKDCVPFLVETTEKLFVFATETSELEDWTQKLCEIAFPMNWNDRPILLKKNSIQRSVKAESATVSMEDNSLYNTRESVKEFKVVIRKTEATERCHLRGTYILKADYDSLSLKDVKSGEILYTWPYRFLRRFGRDKVTFSFEAGRRCESGEGNFEFDTKNGNALFQAIELAINVQKSSFANHKKAPAGPEEDHVASPRSHGGGNGGIYSLVNDAAGEIQERSAEALTSGVKSLTLDSKPLPRKAQVKNIASCPILKQDDQTYSQISLIPGQQVDPEKDKGPPKGPPKPSDHDSEYAVPFDTIAKNLSATFRSFSLPVPDDPEPERESYVADIQGPEPLYDSIDEMAVRSRSKSLKPTYTRVEHIYDEPEGCAAAAASVPLPSLYDDPEEMKGFAWKLQGTPTDPAGHEYPYNPNIDDYAVPKPAKKAFQTSNYNNGSKDNKNLDTTYDNVMIKFKDKADKTHT
ncbi:docking protein 2 isoform X2 [Amia ocellicauda]|uniref:docking protein 2 isoform X2 n=1 Tax=Amia ocellicauda TaxID=2972642 RepID=UPI003464415C